MRGPASQAAVDSVVEGFGISEADARERLETQEPALELEERLRERYPTSFGGLWFDHDRGGRVQVAFTSNVDAQFAVARCQYPYPARLESRHVQYTLASLEAIHAAFVARGFGAPLEDGSIPHAVVVDTPSNSVVVRVEGRTAATDALLQQRFDTPAIRSEKSTGIPVPS